MGQWSHLYFGKEWRRARARFLREHPLCAMCDRFGKVTAATVVDHIRPHRGDMALFWDQTNWSPLCKPCHDGPKQRRDKTGVGADINGYPLNPNKHWA
jgi:5-methylcytosine-specific restriction protein A